MTGVPAPYQPVPVGSRSNTRPGQRHRPTSRSRQGVCRDPLLLQLRMLLQQFRDKERKRSKHYLFLALPNFLPLHVTVPWNWWLSKLALSRLPKRTIAKCGPKGHAATSTKGRDSVGPILVGDLSWAVMVSKYSIGR